MHFAIAHTIQPTIYIYVDVSARSRHIGHGCWIASSLQYNTHFDKQLNCWSLRCSWSIAYLRCSNYSFILHLTLGFNILRKDNCKQRREIFCFGIWCVIYWKFYGAYNNTPHYDDIIMSAVASQITSLTIVYSTVYSGADQGKHQSSAWLAFVRVIHRGLHRGPAQTASDADNVSIWWRHNDFIMWDVFRTHALNNVCFWHQNLHIYIYVYIPVYIIHVLCLAVFMLQYVLNGCCHLFYR